MNTKQLRQKILDLAIRGKLVAQDPNDEPASALLEKIRAEKQRLVKEGKIKPDEKQSGSDKPHYQNVPFEVPGSWVWVRLNKIGTVITGSTPSKSNSNYYGNDYPFFKPTDLDAGISTIIAHDNLSKEGFKISRQLPKESILVTCIGATIGKTGLIRVEGTCNQQINAIIPNFKLLFPKYLYYICISNYFQNKIKNNATATTLPILNKGNFEKLSIPLPPLSEQHRIVSVIESAFSLIDEIENNKLSLEQIIKQVKAKTLDLAIRGKLVEQDPNDEPASVLLERIRKEQKTKKQTADISHYPFDVPQGWVWCKLREICEINPKNNLNDDTTVSFIPMALISDGFSNKHTSEIKKWQEIEKGFTHFQEGDVGIAKITPCFENRKSVIFQNLENGYGAGTTELHILRPILEPFLSNYIIWFVKTKDFIISGVNNFSGAVGQQRVGKSIIEGTYLPLPPLSEQKRIVSKIEQIFSQLDDIEKSLRA